MKEFVLFITLCLSLGAFAQSSKDVVRKGIISQKIVETDYSEGLDEGIVEKEEFFNAKGDLIELKEYNSKGEANRWEKYTYTDDGKIKSELYYTKKGKLDKKIVYVYEDGLKKEKLYYNSKETLVKKKEYVYEFRK